MHLGNTTRRDAAGLRLTMGPAGIVDFTATSALQFTTDRAWRSAKAFGTTTDAALIVTHGHDNGPILGRQVDIGCGIAAPYRIKYCT